MNYFKRLTALLLSTVMLFNTTSVLADTNQTIEYEEGATANNESVQAVEFTMSKGSTFTVCLPKEIAIQDEGDYFVKAGIYADIAATHKLVIESTVDDLVLKNIVDENKTPKEDVSAEVTDIKTEWSFNDADLCADVSLITLSENQVDVCMVNIPKLSSGKWEGNLPIRIALEEDPTTLDVVITDESSKDLNGVATFIKGTTKDTLLSELVDSGYIESVNDISALVDVNCEAFEDTATATFSVKGIAEPGDRIVVYHYDEDNMEWEYIDMATVDENYQIVCEFDSFSPVGFMNIGSVEEGHVCNYSETIIREASCLATGLKRLVCECGANVIESVSAVNHNIVNDICTYCNKSIYELGGLFDSNGTMLCDWEASGIDVEKDYTYVEGEVNCYKSAITSSYYVLNKYTTATKMIIPEGVTRIGDFSVYRCEKIEDIALPESVITIGKCAFQYATNLKSITIPSNCEVLGYACLNECKSLTSIVIPASVKSIGALLLGGSPVTQVVFEDREGWYLGDSAGDKTIALNSDDLSDPATTAALYFGTVHYYHKYWTKEHVHRYSETVTKEPTCIEGIKTLTCECGDIYTEAIPAEHTWDSEYTIDVEPTCTTTGSESIHCNTCNATKDIRSISKLKHNYVSNVCKVCGYELVAGLYDNEGKLLCAWDKSGINVEKDYTGSTLNTDTSSPVYVITQIYKDTTQVVLPDNITKIGALAFNTCGSLKEVIIPYGVTTIGYGAFANNNLIEYMVIPDSVTEIGDFCFSVCLGLKDLVLSKNLTKLNYALINHCPSLQRVVLPDNLKSIVDDAIADYRTGVEEVVYQGGTYTSKLALITALKANNVACSDNVFDNTKLEE